MSRDTKSIYIILICRNFTYFYLRDLFLHGKRFAFKQRAKKGCSFSPAQTLKWRGERKGNRRGLKGEW